MALCAPQDTEFNQIGIREQALHGTAETLTANDFKCRIKAGVTPEYTSERVDRNLACASRAPISKADGKKSLALAFSSELNTPDTFTVAPTASMSVSTMVYQADNIVRVTFESSPSLAFTYVGDYLTVQYSTVALRCGTFLIVGVNSPSNYIDVLNLNGTSAAHDEDSSTPALAAVQAKLDYQSALNCCGAKVHGLSRIAIVSISNGPFAIGETISGNITTGAGVVVTTATSGDSYIYFLPTGTVPMGASDTNIIAAGSGASAALDSATPEIYGCVVKPESACNGVATVEYQEDGFAWSARDAKGNFSINIPANAPGTIDFTMQGPRGTIGTKALTTGITRGTELPPIAQDSEFTLDSFSPVWTNITFDAGNNVVLRENGNANDDTGYEGARISGKRNGKFTMTAELVLPADYDYYSKLDAGTEIEVTGHLGSAETKQIWFHVPRLQLDEIPLGDIDGARSIEITGTMLGTSTTSVDDEWMIAFIGN